MLLLPETLRDGLGGSDARLFGRRHTVALATLGCALDTDVTGAHVLLRTRDQLFAALALIELDGVAARIVIAPPDLKPEHLPSVIQCAAIDVIIGEDPALSVEGVRFEQVHLPQPSQARLPLARDGAQEVAIASLTKRRPEGVKTEWVLFTSGTTGQPKMVAHSLEGLRGAIQPVTVSDIVWGTFYDIRRYGGLQVFLRALLGQSSLILSDADDDVADFLARLGRHGVTHLTGTPSHWRRALMSPANAAIAPRYVRLSGEIADQAILDSLKARFPDAVIGHAYASTEAGVGFEVTDGLEGFPASFIGQTGPVELKVANGTLHIRSPRTASRYVDGSACEAGQKVTLKTYGWIDTGDLVELRGGRYFFAGRTGGIINVGGLKINPEEVEAVINRHPGVRMSRVSGRRNPIVGAVVVAEVVLSDAANDNATFRQAILDACRKNLPAFKVPAVLRFVRAFELTAGGKLARVKDAGHA